MVRRQLLTDEERTVLLDIPADPDALARLNDYEQGRSPTWAMLKGIAGDVNQSVEAQT